MTTILDQLQKDTPEFTDEQMGQLGRLANVKLLGHIDDIAPVLAEVDIVALPSYREGTPKILLEAAACGLPIVATDIAGCRGVVEHGTNGFLVPPKDTIDLVGSINQLCADPILRKTMGAQGRKIVQRGFSSQMVISKTLDVYRSLMDGNAGQ